MASLIRTELEARALLREHGLDVAGWRFQFDHARKRGGYCRYDTKTISMSKYLVPMWSDEEVRQTLLHEVAHALCGPNHGHGPVWRRMARMIGCDAERTHSNATVDGRYVSECVKCGKMTGTRHRRPKSMVTGYYLHGRGCGGQIKWTDTARVGKL